MGFINVCNVSMVDGISIVINIWIDYYRLYLKDIDYIIIGHIHIHTKYSSNIQE